MWRPKMCVRNFHMISVLLLALLCSVTQVFAAADVVNCKPYKEGIDGRCLYFRITDGRIANLWSVEEGKDARDRANAVPFAEFGVYAPQDTTKGLTLTSKSDDSKVKNGTKVKADSVGIAKVGVRGDYEMANIHVGIITTSRPDPIVNNVYNFYAPELKYFIKGEQVTDKSKFYPEVGETVVVDVKLFVPEWVGPTYSGKGSKGGEIDTAVSQPFYFNLPGDTENLIFHKSSGEPLLKDKDSKHPDKFRLDFVRGEASFKITASKAVSGVYHFSLGSFDNPIDPKGDGEFIVEEPFPGELKFVNPDLPVLDSASIYDNDGDGIGDSIYVWFTGNMDSVTVQKFYYSWPSDSNFVTYGGSEKSLDNKHQYSLPDAETSLQPADASGALKAYVCTTVANRCDTLKTALNDRIGAAIQLATLVDGRDGDLDTLVITFNKEMDTTWTQGQGFIVNGSEVSVKAIEKNGATWKYVVDNGKIHVDDLININTGCDSKTCPDGVLTAADGIPTAYNNQKVPVMSSNAVYANENNGFYDRDGDGRMDSLSLGFDNPITMESLKNMEVTFYWLDTNNKLLAITPDIKDLTLSDDGTVLGFALDPEKYGVQKMLTVVDSAYMHSESYGYAKVTNKITVVGKDSITVSRLGLNDYMAPVISETFLKPESFQYMEPDKFSISFTEPIGTEKFKLNGSCFSFLVDGEWVSYSVESAEWSKDKRTVTFRMEAGTQLDERMNPADSVRFNNFSSGIQDRFGNTVSDKSPAAMVKGDPRVIVLTTSFADLNRAEELSDKDKAFTFTHVKDELNKDDKSSLGVLMDVGFSTIMKQDTIGGYELDRDKIGLAFELHVYTNLGAYVGGTADNISCSDKFFKGDCFENPDKLYVRWNMRSDENRKVGVGVYLAKFKVKVYGAKEDFKIERIFRWGVTATKR